MATATDVRDGRTTSSRPIGEQMEQVIAGFTTTLKTFNARLGEVINAQRDGNAHLKVMERALSDQVVIMGSGGGGGTKPAVHTVGSSSGGSRGVVQPKAYPGQAYAGVVTASDVLAHADVTALAAESRRTIGEKPYSTGLDYAVDAEAGNYGQQTRTGIRSGVANWLTGKQKNLAYEYELHRGERVVTKGKNKGGIEGPVGGYFMDENGRYRHPLGMVNEKGVNIGGSFASAEDAVGMVMSEQERTGLGNQLAKSAITARMGQAWAQSGSISKAVAAGLPTGALKLAGGVAAGAYAAEKGLEWVQGQAAQNRTLQEAYGGDLGDQWGDRGAQWVNRNITGRFSMLGMENYDKLFGGAMGLGLRGNDRQSFINTGAGIMGQGVNAQQTMQLMSMSIESGQGLGGLAKAIKDVGNAAKEAGINAGRARDIFIKNYEASSEIMFGTQNAPALATMLTQGQLAMGRQYQNVSMAPALQSTSLQAARASQVGMGLGAFQYATTQSPAGDIIGAEGFIVEKAGGVPNPSGGPRLQELVDQYMAAHPEYNPTYDTDALGLWIVKNGYYDSICQAMLKHFGNMDVSLAQAPGVLANYFTKSSPGHLAARSDAEKKKIFTPTAVTQAEGAAVQGKAVSADKNTAASLMLGITNAPASSSKSSTDAAVNAYWEGVSGGAYNGEDWFAKNDASGSGKGVGTMRIPSAEEFVRQFSSIGADLTKTKVRVMTTGPDGKLLPKVVSVADAFKYFPDQIGTTATFVSGVSDAYMGKTGSEITGAPQADSGVYPDSSKKTIPADVGQTDAQFDAEQKKKAEADAGKTTNTKVTIDFTPYAKSILTKVIQDQYSNPSPPIPGT